MPLPPVVKPQRFSSTPLSRDCTADGPTQQLDLPTGQTADNVESRSALPMALAAPTVPLSTEVLLW